VHTMKGGGKIRGTDSQTRNFWIRWG